jgi:hypothetical protein
VREAGDLQTEIYSRVLRLGHARWRLECCVTCVEYFELAALKHDPFRPWWLP